MIESGLLGAGLVNGVISEKHLNLYKQLHSMIALALHILHFNNFYTIKV